MANSNNELGKLIVRVDLDGANFQKGIANLNRQMRIAESEFKAAGATLGNFGKGLDGLKLKSDFLAKQVAFQRAKIDELKKSYEKLSIEKGKDGAATQAAAVQLNKAITQHAQLEKELTSTNEKIKVQSSSWFKMGQHLQTVGEKMQGVGHKLSGVGETLSVLVSGPIAALGGESVRESIKFESAFAGVKKTVSATNEQFATFRQQIRDMAKNIPATAEEISHVAETAGQLGIKNESLMKFTRVMVDLGVSTNLSADQAATALARLANITQMPQDQFDRLGATIVHLGNNSATTESQIVDMGLRIAGAGHQVNMSEAQILGFAAAMSSVGIQAESGGSAISRVMVTMANEVEKGGAKLDLFAKVAGVSSDKFKKAFKEDAAGAIITFIEGLGKMKDSGKNVFGVLQDLGLSEIRVRDTLLRASGAGKLFRDEMNLANDGWKKNTALTNEANQRYKTTESQLKILTNKLKDIAITLGDALTPVLLDVIKSLQPFINKIADLAKGFSHLSPDMKDFIIYAGGFAMVLPPVIMFVSHFATSVGTLVEMLGGAVGAIGEVGGAAAIASGPIGWIALGVGALVTAGVLLYENWDKLQKKFPILMKVMEYTNPLVNLVANIKDVEKVVKDVGDFFSSSFPKADVFGDKVSKATKKAVGAYLELDDKASKALLDLEITGKKVTKDTSDSLISTFDDMGQKIKDSLDKRFNQSYQVLSDFFAKSKTLSKQEEDKVLKSMTDQTNERKKRIDEGEKQIKQIMEKASKEKRALTEDERIKINSIQQQMKIQAVKYMSDTEVESRSILTKLEHESSTITARQAAEIVQHSKEVKDKTIKNAQDQYNKVVKEIIKQRDETGTITTSQADKMIKEAKRQRDETVKNAQNMHTEIVKEAKKQAHDHVAQVDWETGHVYSKFEKMGKDVKSYFSKITLADVGVNIINSLIGGLGSVAPNLYQKAQEIANHVETTIKKALKINSPSRVMMEIGAYTGEGLAIGLSNSIPKITHQARRMANAATASPSAGMGRLYGGRSVTNNSNVINNNNFNIYSQDARLTESGLGRMMQRLQWLEG